MSGGRSIFEEVGDDRKRAPQPAGGLIDRPSGARRGVRLWLGLLFALVLAMIAVGGLTRLTDSGLSITEWDLVTGTLPPLDAAAWQAEFERYQATPEYRLQNHMMTLEEFKGIYWWEWAHRFLGRIVGLVWAAGFLGFLAARRMPPGWTMRLLLLGALGGAQGAIGWWMVASGLTGDRIDVASYRLAVHLGLAFAILGLIAWYMLALSRSEAALMQARRVAEPRRKGLATGLMHLAFVQILLGALVAGIDAGRTFTDWPLMAGGFFPPDPFMLEPAWRNFFEDPGLVQFLHRIVAYLLFAFGLFAWSRGRASPHRAVSRAFDLVAALLVLQFVLGIVTLMMAAPLALGLAHQLGAVALFVAVIRARFLSAHPPAQSVRDR